jgi:glycosyltransferase involved in cell wall biosynthesis
MNPNRLAVIETHPVQYHAPVYRALQQFGVPVTAVYGSDFSVAGYRDLEFGESFAWDTELLAGYDSIFLSRLEQGGGRTAEEASARGLRLVLHQVQPAAILLLGYSPPFFQRVIVEAWRIGCPLLFRGETTDHGRPRGRWMAWLRDRLLQVLYRRCARLLFVGQRSRQHFLRLGCPEEKLVFSPYCVDVAPFRTTEADLDRLRGPTRRALGVAEGQKVLLFSGKLCRRKGVDLLLRAVKQLPAGLRKELVVVFLGSGELQGELEHLAHTATAVKVRFTGFQNQTRLSGYYHAADLLALPSVHSETWGLVVNEALHHGVPAVVSKDVGCGSDLVEPGVTGEVCETGSVDGLAAAITRCLAWAGSEAVRTRCRDQVSNYTTERAAAGIAGAFRAVTASAPYQAATPCLLRKPL